MRKTQLWYMDLIIGLTIFTLILVLSFRYISSNYTLQGKETNTVLIEADKLSQVLMTPGVPNDWTQDNVMIIGLTTEDNVLNTTKLDYLHNMTQNDYSSTKNIIGIKSDFIIYFQDKNSVTISITNPPYVGYGLTVNEIVNSNPEDIATVDRYIIYKKNEFAEIITMKVMLWQ